MSRSKVMLLVWMAGSAAAFAVPARARDLGLDQRVAAQADIEGVYWRHRIWPDGNEGPKPALSEVVPESALRATVENALLESKALERIWGRPISDADLRAEIDRMAATSRAPGVLEEIFAALGNDPVLVAEALARPILADRLIREAYARDPRFHGDLKASIEQLLKRRPMLAELRREADDSEAIWVRGGKHPERAATVSGARVIPMDDAAWRRGLSRFQDREVGVPGSLQEDDERFFVQAIVEKSDARVRVVTVSWPKKPFDQWWAETSAALSSEAGAGASGMSRASVEALPPLAPASCVADTWAGVQTTGAPSTREAASAVWTGAEMIVWGGYDAFTDSDTNTGGRYNPATNSWSATTTTNAPELRDSHVGVWTGTKMVLWGGCDIIFNPKNTGSRYDPATNTWAATTTTNAPAGRIYTTAVWSGSKMIVWGGWNGTKDLDTGAFYDPATDVWTATAKQGSPTARDTHSVAWAGSRMVIWGGQDDLTVGQNTGARFDPAANTWTATSLTNAPTGRWMHSTVSTGSLMIVWGGFDGASDQGTGGLYDPATDTWTATSTTNAPLARESHVAVWAGEVSDLILWGGEDDSAHVLNTGGRYNPATGVWTATSTTGTPLWGLLGASIWTGTEMIVWGGRNLATMTDMNTGGRYCDGACASPPPGGGSSISLSQGPEMVSWSTVGGADRYDLVRGSLTLLNASGGNFTTAVQACLANDQVGTSFTDATQPPAGSGFFYLVRGTSCGGAGTYDSVGGNQVGSRDAEIAASANACP
ncbi:MAG TPA: hypothetical protein VGS03_21010 [Candidatus Polarisedimenticolia bacterium]|jgi:N-acetylneuraminic acid mutarotase|nr:hypothetical protein [Candidatus Polarisedimenticolia bacterium]